MKLISLEEFKEVLKIDKERGEEALIEFKKDLDKHPGHALNWSDGVFERVALKEEAEYILKLLNNKKNTVEVIDRYLSVEVLTRAQWPSHSTSPTGNLYEEYQKTAKAKLLYRLRGGF